MKWRQILATKGEMVAVMKSFWFNYSMIRSKSSYHNLIAYYVYGEYTVDVLVLR